MQTDAIARKDERSAMNETGQTTDTKRTNPQPTTLDEMPVVKHWNPSRISGALGVVCFFVFPRVIMLLAASFFALAFGAGDFARDAGECVGAIVATALAIVYAAVFYPSYFTDSPVLKRSDDISFANYFAGGIIFGYLWNKNIRFSQYVKRPEKGVSYIVAMAMGGVAASCLVASFCVGLLLGVVA